MHATSDDQHVSCNAHQTHILHDAHNHSTRSVTSLQHSWAKYRLVPFQMQPKRCLCHMHTIDDVSCGSALTTIFRTRQKKSRARKGVSLSHNSDTGWWRLRLPFVLLRLPHGFFCHQLALQLRPLRPVRQTRQADLDRNKYEDFSGFLVLRTRTNIGSFDENRNLDGETLNGEYEIWKTKAARIKVLR